MTTLEDRMALNRQAADLARRPTPRPRGFLWHLMFPLSPAPPKHRSIFRDLRVILADEAQRRLERLEEEERRSETR
jgi:hypothetical protein